MLKTEKDERLIDLCKRQLKALEEGGFRVGSKALNGIYSNINLDEDSPELFMHSFDYDAYKYLLERGLVNSGICPKCGFSPINLNYKFIRHDDNRIQTAICYNCASERKLNVKNLAKISKCYIATICYESEIAPEVLLFQKYRDTVLIKTILGKIFIKIYYTFSPNISNLLNGKKVINKFIIKAVFNPLYITLNKRFK